MSCGESEQVIPISDKTPYGVQQMPLACPFVTSSPPNLLVLLVTYQLKTRATFLRSAGTTKAGLITPSRDVDRSV